MVHGDRRFPVLFVSIHQLDLAVLLGRPSGDPGNCKDDTPHDQPRDAQANLREDGSHQDAHVDNADYRQEDVKVPATLVLI